MVNMYVNKMNAKFGKTCFTMNGHKVITQTKRGKNIMVVDGVKVPEEFLRGSANGGITMINNDVYIGQNEISFKNGDVTVNGRSIHEMPKQSPEIEAEESSIKKEALRLTKELDYLINESELSKKIEKGLKNVNKHVAPLKLTDEEVKGLNARMQSYIKEGSLPDSATSLEQFCWDEWGTHVSEAYKRQAAIHKKLDELGVKEEALFAFEKDVNTRNFCADLKHNKLVRRVALSGAALLVTLGIASLAIGITSGVKNKDKKEKLVEDYRTRVEQTLSDEEAKQVLSLTDNDKVYQALKRSGDENVQKQIKEIEQKDVAATVLMTAGFMTPLFGAVYPIAKGMMSFSEVSDAKRELETSQEELDRAQKKLENAAKRKEEERTL